MTLMEGDGRDWPYPGIRGVAVMPPKEEIAVSSWLAFCVDRLRKQGVLFLDNEGTVGEYLATEGSYWTRDDTPVVAIAGHVLKAPTWQQKMAWLLTKPHLPVDAELVRREAMHRVD